MVRIWETVEGPEHPNTAHFLHKLGFLLINLNRPKDALEVAIRSAKADLATLAHLLSFTPESQRLAYQAATQPCNLFGCLGNGPALAEAVLHHKGIVLDSLLEDRLVAQSSKDPEQRARIDQLKSAKQRLTHTNYSL